MDNISVACTSDSDHSVADELRAIIGALEPPLTSKCCIYKVPPMLRMVNEVAYTPQLISIGPFHHGKNNLQMMEKQKERLLARFIQRRNIISLEILVSSIMGCEEDVRRCYAETINLSSHDFVRMILLDGAFIIEYFIMRRVTRCTDENDKVLYQPWMVNIIQRDLILLENQLPFFVLEKLCNLAFSLYPNYRNDFFLDVTLKYFSSDKGGEEVKHFTDLVRKLYIPPLTSSTQPKPLSWNRFSYNAVELHAAGVKFKAGTSNCRFGITFKNGVIEIPHLSIDDSTESTIRNIMALEQCHYPDETYVSEFINLMDKLIDTEKDVELLAKKGIILNWLGSNDALASIFNNLCLNITVDNTSYFDKVCKDLTEYYDNPWHKWKAIFKRDYLSTPWLVASTLAAFTLLVLTFIQTVNSFK